MFDLRFEDILLQCPYLQSDYMNPASHTFLCKAKRDSRLCNQLALGFTVLCSICEAFVRARQVDQSSMEQPRHHVLTCSDALYKSQYFNTV